MAEKIDLRGLNCPEPVIRTRRLFENQAVLQVEALVDDGVCVANLERLARSLKAAAHVSAREDHFCVVISRGQSQAGTNAGGTALAQSADAAAASPAHAPDSIGDKKSTLTVVFVAKDQLGRGDEEFSRTLLNVFLQTLHESGHQIGAVLLANSGVKLMAKDSPALKVLDDFKAAGCEVLACGLCVKYYGLEDQIPKEQITNMFAICEYLAAADKVISP